MTSSALTAALERRAFAATRRFEELAAFHVPFEDLVDRPKTIERRLELVLDRGGRAAVIAASGGGKSSVLSSLLHPPADFGKGTYAPVRLGIGMSAVDVLGDPRQLALRAIGDLATSYLDDDDAAALRAKGALAVRVSGRSESVRRQLGTRGTALSKEIRQATESFDFERSAGDVLGALAEAMRRLRDDGLKPVLLLEDADGLLGLARVREVAGDGLLASFFGGGLSSVVREVEVPVLIAVQPAYRDHDSFEAFRRDLLDETVALPPPSEFTESGVNYLVGRALRTAGVTASPNALFDEGAMTTLAKVRYAMATVRQLISVCAQALAHAEAGGGNVVTEDDVAYGIGQAGMS